MAVECKGGPAGRQGGPGLALRVADSPPPEGGGLRVAITVAALALSIMWTGSQAARDYIWPEVTPCPVRPPTRRPPRASSRVTTARLGAY